MKRTQSHKSIYNRAKKVSSQIGLSVAISAIAPMYLAANAQDVTEEPEARQNTIIVTATKRDESIQDIPASISQISGEDLSARGISDVESLTNLVPNLVFGKFASNSFVTIRGIGTSVDSGVAEPSVAMYVDGVFMSRSTMSVTKQTDLQRVEVLRGPQGTLYGRNATGGAINFISQKPTSDFTSGGTLTFEERDGVGVNGYVSGPLGDKAGFRLSGGFKEQDGYVEILNGGDALSGSDVSHVRGALQFDPTENLTLDFTLSHEEDNSNYAATGLIGPPGTALFLGGALGAPVNFTTEPNELFADSPNSNEQETTLATFTVNADINDDISFRSITGYVDHSVNSFTDGDSTDFFLVDIVDFARNSETFSQEFNVFGSTDRLDWLVGAYYFEEEYDLFLPVVFNGALFGAPVPSVEVIGGDLVEETTSFALFSDFSFALTDRLTLNGGLRFNSEEKDFQFFGAASPAGSIEEEDVLPKVGLQYALTDEINVYGQWQIGIKSGGHQLDRPELFGSEELEAFEFGIKSQFMDGKVTANAALFFYDYADLQATITLPPATTLVQNGDADVTGFEGELFFDPSENLRINLGVTVLDSEYKELQALDQTNPTGPLVDLSGEQLIRSPESTANIGAEWRIPVQSEFIGDILLRGDAFYSSDFKLTLFDFDETRQDEYTQVNLSATITDPSDRFALRVFVDNATDEVILQQGTFGAVQNSFAGNYSEPRTAGVAFSARF